MNELGVLLSFRHALQAMKSPSSTFELMACGPSDLILGLAEMILGLAERMGLD